MAHHNNTPAAVLAAPVSTPRYSYRHTGPNRADRRHYRTPSGAQRFIPKPHQRSSVNVPAVRP